MMLRCKLSVKLQLSQTTSLQSLPGKGYKLISQDGEERERSPWRRKKYHDLRRHLYSQQVMSGHSVHLEYSCAASEVSTIRI